MFRREKIAKEKQDVYLHAEEEKSETLQGQDAMT